MGSSAASLAGGLGFRIGPETDYSEMFAFSESLQSNSRDTAWRRVTAASFPHHVFHFLCHRSMSRRCQLFWSGLQRRRFAIDTWFGDLKDNEVTCTATTLFLSGCNSEGGSSFVVGWYNRDYNCRRTKWTQSHPPQETKKKSVCGVDSTSSEWVQLQAVMNAVWIFVIPEWRRFLDRPSHCYFFRGTQVHDVRWIIAFNVALCYLWIILCYVNTSCAAEHVRLVASCFDFIIHGQTLVYLCRQSFLTLRIVILTIVLMSLV
jgi:hypothetical protein